MLYVIGMCLNNQTLSSAMSVRGHRANWYRNTGFSHKKGNDLFQEDSDLISNYVFNSVWKRWWWGRQVSLRNSGFSHACCLVLWIRKWLSLRDKRQLPEFCRIWGCHLPGERGDGNAEWQVKVFAAESIVSNPSILHRYLICTGVQRVNGKEIRKVVPKISTIRINSAMQRQSNCSEFWTQYRMHMVWDVWRHALHAGSWEQNIIVFL